MLLKDHSDRNDRNVSVNSKPDHSPPPRATPGDLHVITAPGVGFSPNFLCPGDWGFELEKFPAVLKEKGRNFLICVKVYIFAKTVDVYCIFNNIDHFRPFRSF